jgi:hypothetical protein
MATSTIYATSIRAEGVVSLWDYPPKDRRQSATCPGSWSVLDLIDVYDKKS